MFDVPLPVRIVPDAPSVAKGTFDGATVSTIRLPPVAGCEVEERPVGTPMGVFVILLSIEVTEPTCCLPEVAADTSMPTLQL
jgi:hypothetical protein